MNESRAAEGSGKDPTKDLTNDPTSAPPPAPEELFAAGLQHLSAGRPLDAQICCRRALEIDAGFADALHLLGLIALQAQQYDHAIEWLVRAVRQDANPDYLVTLATCLKLCGRLDEAVNVFDKAVQLRPGDAELWKHLGGALVAGERHAEALLAYQQALRLDPQHAEAALQSALLLHRMERFEEALTLFDLCDQLKPDHAATPQARAQTLRRLMRYEACLAELTRAHALAPGDPIICNNIGDALFVLGRFEDGLDWFEKALAQRPDLAEIWVNKARALTRAAPFR